MVFLAGPRQVGKTTTSLLFSKDSKDFLYLNWDEDKSRQKILSGSEKIALEARLLTAGTRKPIIVFDEIHKYGRWKQFLKGFFDAYGSDCHILVTGSAKLNIYKRSGDSLMGRYFLYRIHPLSVAELLYPQLTTELIRPPKKIAESTLNQLVEFGGFPEPFLMANHRFSTNWQRTRREQLIREDIRDLSKIQELSQLEVLATLLQDHAAQQVSLQNFANLINISVPTVGRWLETLETFYYSFSVRPWSKQIKRSLRKEPKYYLWDWSLVQKRGARLENLVASHLLKAVHFWTDCGQGEFDLFYLRDKEKREVDFIVTKDRKPWFLVEVKAGNHSGISKALYYFQEQTGAPHAFQVCFGLDYVNKDCFSYSKPVIVPASTFLSQLV
ncbi:MAG: ATP-binding protein [Gammaproteobacteria bacterium]|nr:ATP-binding protein [Gammaproteobacteria bacterium]